MEEQQQITDVAIQVKGALLAVRSSRRRRGVGREIRRWESCALARRSQLQQRAGWSFLRGIAPGDPQLLSAVERMARECQLSASPGDDRTAAGIAAELLREAVINGGNSLSFEMMKYVARCLWRFQRASGLELSVPNRMSSSASVLDDG